jgi:hypothetical protein
MLILIILLILRPLDLSCKVLNVYKVGLNQWGSLTALVQQSRDLKDAKAVSLSDIELLIPLPPTLIQYQRKTLHLN